MLTDRFSLEKTVTLCVEDTMYDLVIGNIDGSNLDDMSHFSVVAVSRSRANQSENAYRKLKVPDQIINEDKEALTLDKEAFSLPLLVLAVRIYTLVQLSC